MLPNSSFLKTCFFSCLECMQKQIRLYMKWVWIFMSFRRLIIRQQQSQSRPLRPIVDLSFHGFATCASLYTAQGMWTVGPRTWIQNTNRHRFEHISWNEITDIVKSHLHLPSGDGVSLNNKTTARQVFFYLNYIKYFLLGKKRLHFFEFCQQKHNLTFAFKMVFMKTWTFENTYQNLHWWHSK